MLKIMLNEYVCGFFWKSHLHNYCRSIECMHVDMDFSLTGPD